MISIITPTHDRPGLLREALESVYRQAAFNAIDEIIVSDNGPDHLAKAVCAEFKDKLPMIKYTARPECSAHDHGKQIFEDYFAASKSKYTSILHCDDWLTPSHLSSALSALESVPSASFYTGCHYDVRSPNSMLFCTHNFYAWFAANFASLNCAWIIPPENAVLSMLFGCIGHYSTMVMRTDAFKEASYVFHEPESAFNSDRRLQFALSQLGPVIYNPMPQVFVRHHADRDCVVNYTDDERIRHLRMTTLWIIKRFNPSMILDKFCAQFDACPKEFRANAAQYLSQEWTLPEISRYMKKNGIKYDKEIPGVTRILGITP